MATIRKRGESYQIRVSCGYDAKGNQVVKTMTYKPLPGVTKKQLEKELNRQALLFEEKVSNGLHLDGNIKLYDFAEMWFKDYAAKQLKASTVEGYKYLLKRLNAYMGHIRLIKLQPHHIIEFYERLSEEAVKENISYCTTEDLRGIIKAQGLSQRAFCEKANVDPSTLKNAMNGKAVAEKTASKIEAALQKNNLFQPVESDYKLSDNTVKHYHSFLSSMLSTAVEWQIIPSNPCDRVKPPKVKKTEAKCLESVEAVQILEKLEGEALQFRCFISLVLFTGMRRGEALGLEWSDIDFNNNVININKSSLYNPSKGTYTDTPKNESSKRAIKIPPEIISLLKKYKAEQSEKKLLLGDLWQNTNRLFTQRNGKPMHPSTPSAQFKKFLEKHNLPNIEIEDIHLHSLRHTNASLLIAKGTDVRTVAKRLGHSTASTTTTIYAHALKSADEMAAESLGDVLGIRAAK